MEVNFLETKGLSKVFKRGENEIWALREVSLIIEKGDFLTITGPSGGGKSTFLHVIGGLEDVSAGEVSFKGQNIADFSEVGRADYRKKSVGFIFQFFHLLPALSVFDNVSIPLLLSGEAEASTREKVTKALERAQISHRSSHLPAELSGGEMQRVAIARAIAHSPELLIADEPTGNLDSKTGQEILSLLQEINTEEKTTLVVATHSEALSSLGNKSIQIVDGRVS